MVGKDVAGALVLRAGEVVPPRVEKTKAVKLKCTSGVCV